MLYLSTVEAGGRTIFPKISLSVKPEAGSLLYWHIRCISHCWVGEDWSDSSNVLSVLSLNHSLLTASGLRAISNMFESVHSQPPNFHLDTLCHWLCEGEVTARWTRGCTILVVRCSTGTSGLATSGFVGMSRFPLLWLREVPKKDNIFWGVFPK